MVHGGERPGLRLRSIPLAAVFAVALSSASVADPVQLHAYPQKFATFYQLGDPAVPETLKRAPGPPPSGDVNCAATATDGARWLGTRTGLIRTYAADDPLDRRQYLGGRRYLPDDDVL